MNEYSVTWTIQVSADSPRNAAIAARQCQVSTYTTAVVFEVFDHKGERTMVDLMEDNE